MVVIHFLENKTVVLTQLLKRIPDVNENIKIKGRKGHILSIKELEGNVIHAQVFFEPIIQKQVSLKDDKKRRR